MRAIILIGIIMCINMLCAQNLDVVSTEELKDSYGLLDLEKHEKAILEKIETNLSDNAASMNNEQLKEAVEALIALNSNEAWEVFLNSTNLVKWHNHRNIIAQMNGKLLYPLNDFFLSSSNRNKSNILSYLAYSGFLEHELNRGQKSFIIRVARSYSYFTHMVNRRENPDNKFLKENLDLIQKNTITSEDIK